MNITNFEIIHSTLETIAALFCLVVAISISMNKLGEKVRPLIIIFFALTSLFFSDACVFIFQHNIDDFSMLMTKVGDTTVFLSNCVLISAFARYCNEEFSGANINVPKKYFLMIDGICLLNVFIILINLFVPYMFYFDEYNVYHRGFLWYFYCASMGIGVFILLIFTIKNFKVVPISISLGLIIYEVVPFVSIIAQFFLPAFSVTNWGIALAAIVLLLFRLSRDTNTKRARGYSGEKESGMFFNVCMLIIVVVFMGAAITTSVIDIQKMASDNFEKECNNIFHYVSADIEKTIQPMLDTSKMICIDPMIVGIVGNDSVERMEDVFILKEYLGGINERFGFTSAFVISNYSQNYFSHNGTLIKLDYLRDKTYTDFSDSNNVFLVDVTNRGIQGGPLSLVIISKILDYKGNCIGIGGVSENLTSLQEKLKYYEGNYGLSINIINKEGIILVSTDDSRINRELISDVDVSTLTINENRYEYVEGRRRIVHYDGTLDWYLVVDFVNEDSFSVMPIIIPCLVIFFIGLIVMGIAFTVLGRQEMKSREKLLERTKLSLTDELTGIYNRRAYEEELLRIKRDNIKDKIVIVMLDVNGLKSVNDRIGHSAGDELLVATAMCMVSAFADYGKIFRTGGDEFVALLECSVEQAEKAITHLRAEVAKWKGKYIHGFSVSLGSIVCLDYPDKDIDELQILSDKLMYEDKRAYYHRIGKDRRKR